MDLQSPGSSAAQLSNPDDATILPDAGLMIPDIRSCRLLFVQPGASALSAQLGMTGACHRQLPAYFAAPRGIPDARRARSGH